MQRFYVNTNVQPNGDHEVHTTGCSTPADVANRLDLGEFRTCFGAVQEAQKTYDQSNGCANCCPDCHSS